MPEGDTVHRAAERLQHALVGREVTAFEAPRLVPPLPRPGETVEAVEARGKHLLVTFSGGLVLHTHLRMSGAWHVYRPRDRWRRSRGAARVVVRTDEVVAVCFSAPVVEVLDDRAVTRHPVLRRLGPDLCGPDPDLDEAIARMAAADPGRSIGETLLDQQVASGIGNVYRSEVCHLHDLDPRTPLGAVDETTRRGLISTAASLLRENLAQPRRTTVPDGRPGSLYVYGRDGRPCRRCGTSIEGGQLGADHPRVVFWCPVCQPRRVAER